LADERFPFWFIQGLDVSVCQTPQGDSNTLVSTGNDRKGFGAWAENLLITLNNIK